MTKTIVVGPFLLIGKHGVGFLNFFEPFLCVGFDGFGRDGISEQGDEKRSSNPRCWPTFRRQDFVVVSFVAHVVVLVVCDAGPDLNLTPWFYRLRPQCGQ